MKRFTDSVRTALQQENWYAALTLTLTLPDICGRIDEPRSPSGARYAAWFDAWIKPRYYEIQVPPRRELHPLGFTYEAAGSSRTIMCGDDCYALRCSFLHQGDADVSGQRAAKIRAALDAFHFVVPPPGLTIHRNQVNRTLQLQVDKFCLEIADSVDAWAAKCESDAAVQERVGSLLRIQIAIPGQAFRF